MEDTLEYGAFWGERHEEGDRAKEGKVESPRSPNSPAPHKKCQSLIIFNPL